MNQSQQTKKVISIYAMPGLRFNGTVKDYGFIDKEEALQVFIKKIVCAYFKIPLDKLTYSKKDAEFIYPRHLFIFLLGRYTQLSQRQMAMEMGRKDHSSAVYAMKSIRGKMKKSKEVAEDVRMLCLKIDCLTNKINEKNGNSNPDTVGGNSNSKLRVVSMLFDNNVSKKSVGLFL